MASASPGKRTWKCPECGNEVELSVTQLDPIACDACLGKLRGGTSSAPSLGSAVAAPLGLWQGLPDTTKLAIAIGALAVGFLIGYVVGSARATAKTPAVTTRSTPTAHESRTPSKTEPAPDEEDSKTVDEPETRPPQPGPDYRWVKGRLRKDGTRGDGHWAKNPNYKGDGASGSK